MQLFGNYDTSKLVQAFQGNFSFKVLHPQNIVRVELFQLRLIFHLGDNTLNIYLLQNVGDKQTDKLIMTIKGD